MFGFRYRYLFILLLGVYSYLNIVVTEGARLFDFEVNQIELYLLLQVAVLLIWEFNRLIEAKLATLTQWFNAKIHPLIILFALSIIHVAFSCTLLLYAVYLSLDMPMVIDFTHWKLLLAFGFRVNLFLNCVNAIVFFMNKLKRAQLRAEQLKQISIEAQFEALRNQINPHFLFNSFNVLSTLVYKDADTASKFIAQLSNVYRYLLYSQDKKVVSLKEEIQFIQSYLYLLQIRFGENLIVQDNLNGTSEKYYIAPATLQMLIENAIKHNVVSRKNPLIIRFFKEGDFLVVSNNLQEKEVKEPSTQVGLKNIFSRYEFLSSEKVHIDRVNGEFIVKIPLIELSEE